VPAKKKSKEKIIKRVVLITAGAAFLFIAYISFLWYTTRKVEFVRYKEFGIPMPTTYEIHGIDVSRYQQRIAWDAVKEMQVANIKLGFAFIKATEGNGRVDPYFKRNWERCKKAGIVRGAYHFFIASRDGKTQAKNFANTVKLESGDLPPVLDVEQTSGQSAPALRNEIKKWLDTLEEYYGVKPVIYTNADFYKNYLEGYFDDYPLWVAHYLQLHQPRVNRTWTFWQHSEKGRVNGIYSKVDFNVFKGDSVAFKSILIP